MKLLAFALGFGLGAAQLVAQSIPTGDPASLDVSAAARDENDLVANAHDVAARGDFDTAASLLARAPASSLKLSPNVALVRRTVEVCGWLCNENQYGKAKRLAERIIPLLSWETEASDADKAELIYWQAWLQAEILDQKSVAIELLQKAATLAPDDERFAELELRLLAAVVEFGR